MPVDPAQLRMLALVAAHGSMAGAAAELGLTPAALTGQVARAERDWGVPLVHRGPRGARRTGAGGTRGRPGGLTGEVAGAGGDWGVPLVPRGPRGARLTEAGATLARHGEGVDELCV